MSHHDGGDDDDVDLGDDDGKYSDDCDDYYVSNPVWDKYGKDVKIIVQAVLSVFIDTTFLFGSVYSPWTIATI